MFNLVRVGKEKAVEHMNEALGGGTDSRRQQRPCLVSALFPLAALEMVVRLNRGI